MKLGAKFCDLSALERKHYFSETSSKKFISVAASPKRR